MTTLKKVQELLPTLTLDEKAQALQGITCTLDVAGGEPCIVYTRIPVWLLIQARTLGSSDVDILRSYPNLRTEDLDNAWNYYRTHTTEIAQQIIENEIA